MTTTNKNQKSNELVNAIFANLQNAGVNVSNGTRREIFKKEIIAGLTDDKAKSFRKKIRKIMLALAETIVQTNGKDAKAIDAFNETYKSAYALNDYTLQSICSDNMKAINKDYLQKALQICKPKEK